MVFKALIGNGINHYTLLTTTTINIDVIILINTVIVRDKCF